MTHESESISPVSELELAALSSAAVPGMQVREIRGGLKQTDSGQWLRLVDANGTHWLAWAPSGPVDQVTMDRHEAVLAVLEQARSEGAIPWTAPQIAGSVHRAGGGVAIVMEYPGGSAVTDADLDEGGLLPTSLGAALAALHELPTEEYKAACMRYADSDTTRNALRALITKHTDAIPSRLRSRWTDALAEDPLWGFQPVPLHGDLSADHVYASQGAVVGLTRFDHAAVGDPAADLVWLMYYASDQFLSAFEEAYARARTSTDLHLLTRAQLLSEIETLRWYSRGFAADDRRWREQGVAALRDLDSDIGDQRLVPHRPEVVEITFGVEDEPLLKLQGGHHSGAGAGPGSGSSSGAGSGSSSGAGSGSGAGHNHASGGGSLSWDTGGSPMRESSDRTTDVLSPHSLETGPYNPFSRDTERGAEGEGEGDAAGIDSEAAHATLGGSVDPLYRPTEETAPDSDAASKTAPGPDVTSATAPGPDETSAAAPDPDATSGTTPDSDAASGTAADPDAASGTTPDSDAASGTTPDSDTASGTTPDSDTASGTAPDSEDAPVREAAQGREYMRPIRRGRTSSFEVP